MTLALIAISAICGAVTDLSFNLSGYMWQLANCAFTAGYSLSLRGAMDKVSRTQRSRSAAPLRMVKLSVSLSGICWFSSDMEEML